MPFVAPPTVITPRFSSQVSWAHQGKKWLAELENALKIQGSTVPQSHCSPMSPIIFFYAEKADEVAKIQQSLRSLPGVKDSHGELSYKHYTLAILHKPDGDVPG